MPDPRPKRRLPLDIQSLARSHTTLAIQTLAGLVINGEPDAVKVSACVVLLDRGWGKPEQPVSGQIDGDIRILIRDLFAEAREMKVIEHD